VIEPWTDEMEQAIYDEACMFHKHQHFNLFPFSQNLSALIFVSTADFSQDQRQSLTSIMMHRNGTMDDTVWENCTVKTAVGNPMMNPSGSDKRRAFVILDDQGELEGSFGY